jgi:hypothetical protein
VFGVGAGLEEGDGMEGVAGADNSVLAEVAGSRAVLVFAGAAEDFDTHLRGAQRV